MANGLAGLTSSHRLSLYVGFNSQLQICPNVTLLVDLKPVTFTIKTLLNCNIWYLMQMFHWGRPVGN